MRGAHGVRDDEESGALEENDLSHATDHRSKQTATSRLGRVALSSDDLSSEAAYLVGVAHAAQLVELVLQRVAVGDERVDHLRSARNREKA